MEKLLKPYHRESLKMAMLKHEETFKEQVCELHRLYRIQKKLMNNIKSSGPRGCSPERWNLENEISTNQANCTKKERRKSRKKLDLERPAKEYIADEGEDGVLEIEDESDIELTLGLTSYSQRKKDETPLTSDSGPSISSSSTESNHMQPRTGTHKRMNIREELTSYEWGRVIQVPDMHPIFQSEIKNTSDVEEKLKQERQQQSPWLFHVLSLNMT